MFCRNCRYNLKGAPSKSRQENWLGSCPECGQSFDLRDPKSFYPDDSEDFLRFKLWFKRWATYLALGHFAAGVLVLLFEWMVGTGLIPEGGNLHSFSQIWTQAWEVITLGVWLFMSVFGYFLGDLFCRNWVCYYFVLVPIIYVMM